MKMTLIIIIIIHTTKLLDNERIHYYMMYFISGCVNLEYPALAKQQKHLL